LISTPHLTLFRGKPPWEPLTPEEYALREPLWNARVEKNREAERGREARARKQPEGRAPRPAQHGQPRPEPAPRVGRNQPCPCGSGRKSKKCCGR
jgi:uncharacterized protein YecA (UPF0149 family)